jgi:hypothetical protein
VRFRVASLILALFLIPSVVLAQSEPVDEAPPTDVVDAVATEAPTSVVVPPLTATLVKVGNGVNLFPTGQDSQSVRLGAVMPSSPAGAPLFEMMLGRPPARHELRLARPNIATYAFSCSAGQCSGAASDVWNAMPESQRTDYLAAMVNYAQQIAPTAKWAEVQIRVSTGDMVQCATTISGVLTFNDGVCPSG